MITAGIYAIIILCAFFGTIIFIQKAIIGKYKNENAELKTEIKIAAKRLEHLREYMQKEKTLMEAGDEKLRELESTPDSGLAGRANALWGGVRNGGTDGGSGAA